MHLSLSALPLCLSPVHRKFILGDIHDLCIITGYQLNDVIPFPTRTGSDYFPSPPLWSDRIWSPPTLLLTAQRGLFLQRLSSLNLKLITPTLCRGLEFVDYYKHFSHICKAWSSDT